MENSFQKRRHKLDRSNDREIEEKKDFFHRKRKQILKIVSIDKRRAYGNSILCTFAGSIVWRNHALSVFFLSILHIFFANSEMKLHENWEEGVQSISIIMSQRICCSILNCIHKTVITVIINLTDNREASGYKDYRIFFKICHLLII